MKWTGLNEIRETYLSFFESKQHTRIESAPLVPIDDNSLLLINSGMAPLKKYFLGQETPVNKRMTSCQKCIRTPDIENVGKTARHGTYFEMIGNFSFGDYFKSEATKWAWEFLTEVLEIPVDKMWVSIYLEDDETFDVWTKEIGVAPERIVRLGKEDNFWEIGSGPCGPCSELYFDRGEEFGCDDENCAVGCECDRYVEFWNIVFSQYDTDGKGKYDLVEHPNIDTGMGLERMACIMQGVNNLFEVDTIQNIMNHISEIANVKYKEDEKTDVSLRVITDHIRSTTFMVADGVMPSNEGRGYVLRRLLRRAARHGRLIGIKGLFLHDVCNTVIEENKNAYPYLCEKAEYVKKVIKIEEERFEKTIDIGMQMLEDIISEINNSNGEKVLSGEVAFKLYDTFGFPVDLTKEIIEEQHISLDEEVFNKLMQEQRQMARDARSKMETIGWDTSVIKLEGEPTEFTGYNSFSENTKVLNLLNAGEIAEDVSEGDDVTIVLAKTPFYAEGGGQVSDRGEITTENCVIKIHNCKKNGDGYFLHSGKVTKGMLLANSEVTAKIDVERRLDIMRNHTAVHIMQSVLKNALGTHVNQAGSFVDEKRLRFDFTHFSPVTSEELRMIEKEINSIILKGLSMETEEMSIDKAKTKGATALFGEKYGDTVRVCTIGDSFSVEFCGGTHVSNTNQLGLFKIVSESSVAAGIRRIEAVTGNEVYKLLLDQEDMITNISKTLKVNGLQEISDKIVAVTDGMKEKDRQIAKLNSEIANGKLAGILENSEEISNDITLVKMIFNNTEVEAVREIAEKIRDNHTNMIAVFAINNNDKGNVIVACGKESIKKGLNSGKIAKEIAIKLGGNGGGRPDLATAGIKETSKIQLVMDDCKNIVEEFLGR